jgi:PhnB protein
MTGSDQSSPKWQTAIRPILSVKKGAAAIEFYRKAFGAEVMMCITSPDGAVVAELSVGGACFFLNDESPEHGNLSPLRLGGTAVRMELSVADPDKVFSQAIAAGAKEIYPVADQSYGYRLGRLEDPSGHHWEIGCPLINTGQLNQH